MSIGTFLVYASFALFLFGSVANILCLSVPGCTPTTVTPGQEIAEDLLLTGVLFLLAKSWHDEDRKY